MKFKAPLVVLWAVVVAAAPSPTTSTLARKRSLLDLGALVDSIIGLGRDEGHSDPKDSRNSDQAKQGGRNTNDNTGSDPLINLAPTVSLGSDNGCFGIGVAVCNPVTVDQSRDQ
jgi:hypothetical protein